MSEEVKESARVHDNRENSALKKQTPWVPFKKYRDEESGVEVAFDKNSSRFSPSINFKHPTGDYVSRHGRITPDFNDLDSFDPLGYIIDALTRLRDRVKAELGAEAQKDKDAFLARKEEREKHAAGRHKRPGEARHTGKTARKKAKLAANKPTAQGSHGSQA